MFTHIFRFICLTFFLFSFPGHLIGSSSKQDLEQFQKFSDSALKKFNSSTESSDLLKDGKQLLGSCFSDAFVRCMTQDCSYCVSGGGSCKDCDEPTGCKNCTTYCKLSGSKQGQSACASFCTGYASGYAIKNCIF